MDLNHQFGGMNINGRAPNAYKAKGVYNDVDPINARSLGGSPAPSMFGSKRIMAPVHLEGYIFHRPLVIKGQPTSWRKAKYMSMPCSQDDLKDIVKQNKDSGVQVMTVLRGLSEPKQHRLHELLDDKRRREDDPRAEWCIVSIQDHTTRTKTKRGLLTAESLVTKSIEVILERKLDLSQTPAQGFDDHLGASGLRAASFSTPPMPGGPFQGRAAAAAAAGGPSNLGDFGPHPGPFRGPPAFNPGGMNGAPASFGPPGRDQHGNAFGVGGGIGGGVGGGGNGPNMPFNGMPPAGQPSFMGGARPGMPMPPMQMPPNGPGPSGPSMQHAPGVPPLRPQMPPIQPNMQGPPPMHGGPMPPPHPIGVPPQMPHMAPQPQRPPPIFPGQHNGPPPPMPLNGNRPPFMPPPPANQFGANGIGRKPVGSTFSRPAPGLDTHGIVQFDSDDEDSGVFTPVFDSDEESVRTGNTSLGSADLAGRSKNPRASRGAYPPRDNGGVHAGRGPAHGDARRYSDRSSRRFGREGDGYKDSFDNGRHRRRSSAAESDPRFDSAFRRSQGRPARRPSSDDEQFLGDSLDEENERVNGRPHYDARHKTRVSGDRRSRTGGAHWERKNASGRHAEDDGYYGPHSRGGGGYNVRRS